MSLFDTIDGAFMNFAYGWAFSQPVRKLFYNLTVTGLSVAVALVIGSIELLGVLDVIGDIDLNLVGYLVVGLFVADLGARARGLALRPHRGALERRHRAAVTRAPERPPLDFARLEDILATLRAAGHRVSAPAARVLDALFAADGPVSADDIAAPTEPRAHLGLPQPRAPRGARRGQPRPRRPRARASTRWPRGGRPGVPRLRPLRPGDDASIRRALDGVRAALQADFGHHARFSHFPIHGLCAELRGEAGARAPARPPCTRICAPALRTGTSPIRALATAAWP